MLTLTRNRHTNLGVCKKLTSIVACCCSAVTLSNRNFFFIIKQPIFNIIVIGLLCMLWGGVVTIISAFSNN